MQAKIIRHLRGQGYTIARVAETATKEPGKDIEGRSPDGKALWVSVKGYPEKSEHTQARHWFAEALFDLVLYRDENQGALLGVGLPKGFATYNNLARRVTWLRRNLPFSFYWVDEAGKVFAEP